MLKNISPIIPPELLAILCGMGHGDEIVIADGNFPAQSIGQKVVRMDGHGGEKVLEAVLSLIPLDTYADQNLLLMEKVPGDDCLTPIWDSYQAIAEAAEGGNVKKGFLERFEFYNRAKNAYAVIATGESALYANIIIKKGVIKQ